METFETSPEKNLNGSIASAQDSPARTFQPLDDAEGLKALAAVFGLSVPVWWGDLNPDTCSLKTFQGCLFTTQYDELSETWPDSGMWAGGVVYELRNSEPVTSESESSLWRTPHPRDDHAQGPRLKAKQRQIYLCDQATTWPTANTKDANSAARHTTTTGVMHPGTTLTDAIRMWPTPVVPSGGRTTSTSNYDAQGNKRQIQLEAVAPLWRTPDGPGTGGPRSHHESIGEGHQVTIAEQAEHWITPNARDWKSETSSQNNRYQRSPNLSRQVYRLSPQAPRIPDGPASSPKGQTSRRRLNPRFVEFLMGFPIGWTEL